MKQGKLLWISLGIWVVITACMAGGMLYYTNYYVVVQEKGLLLSEDSQSLEKIREGIREENFAVFPMEKGEFGDTVCKLPLPEGVTEDAIQMENDYLHQCIYLYIRSDEDAFYADKQFKGTPELVRNAYYVREQGMDIFLFSLKKIKECHYYIEDGQICFELENMHHYYDKVIAVDLEKEGAFLVESFFGALSEANQNPQVKLIYIDRNKKDFTPAQLHLLLKECEADYYLEFLIGMEPDEETGMRAYYQKYFYQNEIGSVELADAALREVVSSVGGQADGLYPAGEDRQELLQAGIPAVALYLGSYSDQVENEMLQSELFADKMAQGVSNMIDILIADKLTK